MFRPRQHPRPPGCVAIPLGLFLAFVFVMVLPELVRYLGEVIGK